MKLAEAAVSFILEDFVEVGLQFFYFEKYALMPNDLLVYFNAVIMVLIALELTFRMILELKNQWNRAVFGVSDPVYSGSFWWKLMLKCYLKLWLNKKFWNHLVHRNQHAKLPGGFLNQLNRPQNYSEKRMLKVTFFEIQEPWIVSKQPVIYIDFINYKFTLNSVELYGSWISEKLTFSMHFRLEFCGRFGWFKNPQSSFACWFRYTKPFQHFLLSRGTFPSAKLTDIFVNILLLAGRRGLKFSA